jgi:hypothetical protein
VQRQRHPARSKRRRKPVIAVQTSNLVLRLEADPNHQTRKSKTVNSGFW